MIGWLLPGWNALTKLSASNNTILFGNHIILLVVEYCEVFESFRIIWSNCHLYDINKLGANILIPCLWFWDDALRKCKFRKKKFMAISFYFIFFLIPYVIGGRKSTDISSYENGFNKIVGKCCEICDCIRCKGCIFRQQIFFYPCYAKYYEERLMFMLCWLFSFIILLFLTRDRSWWATCKPDFKFLLANYESR